MIKGININQGYNDKLVLKNLNLNIYENKLTSIIGPNGAGKSSLLGVLTRLLPLKDGNVFIDDVNLKDLKSLDISKKIGILKQSNNLNIKLSIYDLVSFGRYPYSKGFLNNFDKDIINKSLNYLNLLDMKDSYLDELSGGQRQRAFIAMILAQDTKYIFLDEPLNNLDMKYSSETMNILKKLVKDLKKTIIMVVHDINLASVYSDYIIAMKNGLIYKEGIVSDVITKEVLDKVFDFNFKIEKINNKNICLYEENL